MGAKGAMGAKDAQGAQGAKGTMDAQDERGKMQSVDNKFLLRRGICWTLDNSIQSLEKIYQ